MQRHVQNVRHTAYDNDDAGTDCANYIKSLERRLIVRR